jgi:hypothetical protein
VTGYAKGNASLAAKRNHVVASTTSNKVTVTTTLR